MAGHLILKDGSFCEQGLWNLFLAFLDERIEALGCGCAEGELKIKCGLSRSRETLEFFNRNGCGIDAEKTLAHFFNEGGHCDAEVLLNVGQWDDDPEPLEDAA